MKFRDLAELNRAPEEVTEAMIAAGSEALRAELGGGLTVFWSPDDLAVLVYRAMRDVALSLDHK
jgi:hypothetical protein